MPAKPTASEWTRIMGYGWQQRRAMIAQHLQAMLAELPAGEVLPTRDFVDKLWPEQECRGYEELKARNQFPAAVLKARPILDGWYTLIETGEEKFGKPIRRTQWHNKRSTLYDEALLSKRRAAVDPLDMAARVQALEDRCKHLEDKLTEYGVI